MRKAESKLAICISVAGIVCHIDCSCLGVLIENLVYCFVYRFPESNKFVGNQSIEYRFVDDRLILLLIIYISLL